MSPAGRPRASLTAEQAKRVARASERASAAQEAYRATIVDVLNEGASFLEVSAATGLSTATLQRWKRAHLDDRKRADLDDRATHLATLALARWQALHGTVTPDDHARILQAARETAAEEHQTD